MKRFWLVLLSLGLIAAFSTQALAVDVMIGGEYFAAGMYQDKTTLTKDVGPSTAFYFQRLRLEAVFIVAPGLEFFTRADIMERAWGATRSTPGAGLQAYPGAVQSAGTVAENENIAFDLAYVAYKSPIGKFVAGYQIDGAWGTVFGDNSIPTGKIGYYNTDIPGLMLIAQIGKNSGTLALGGVGGEQSVGSFTGTANTSDRDSNFYTLAAMYQYKNVNAGLLGKYVRLATTRAYNWVGNYYCVLPYVKAKIGPVALQAEVDYVFGQDRKFEYDSPDRRIEVLNAWVDATADFGMFYAGGTLAYLSGQDPSSGARTQGIIDGGFDWNPMLIMFNAERSQWAGALAGPSGNVDSAMANAYFFQARGGVRPIDKLDIGISVSYANAVVKPSVTWLYNDYGWEVDLTATYSITNNLTYMLGAGYLFTGKYFKGASESAETANDFLVINKLTLSF